jgi:hypothetical protein
MDGQRQYSFQGRSPAGAPGRRRYQVNTAAGNGELTLICNKFCVFSDLLSVDYGGFVATLPDPSVASGIAIALRFAADAADWREDRRTERSSENLCSASR